ncbi:Cyclin-dependent kinase C-1 [Gracilariopsis chorda]|uniref:Cyclin-dependent kinase C-1 n=1 Tax=Gracilariopsis chorda TaxID=448386 RepID=A0A2V3IP24_9FLOR|nr:Cyclin-dependent kinase C-1 [Gracilariopsis chorda]|eukprot:PXF43835.1 Cyclin-dependent kinase C-1 [Gracilariopsis chorda]
MATAAEPNVEDEGWDQPINRAPSRKRWRWSREVTDFEEIEQIGEGTYGQVWMGRDKRSGEIVALKKVRMDQEKEGFPVTAIRELKMLRSLRHENIVNLKEIVTGQNQNRNKVQRNKHEIYMVFEYVDHDLTGLMDTPTIHFTEAQVKTYAKQLLSGLWYCHEREVLHRDIKGSNLLIDNKGNLKIADFGLARTFNDHLKRYTNRVITLWYRSPELLLGAEEYGPEVDIWSVGCLLVELLTKKPLFPGKDELEQLDLIFSVLGSPTESIWPGWQQLSLAHTVKTEAYVPRLRQKLKSLSQTALDLIEWLLKLDPKRRPTALEALDHEWFWSKPYPTPREELPKYRSTHEFQAKQRRKENR